MEDDLDEIVRPICLAHMFKSLERRHRSVGDNVETFAKQDGNTPSAFFTRDMM